MQTDSQVILGDNLDVLPNLPGDAFQLIYIDPPFNTGKAQTRKTLQTVCAAHRLLNRRIFFIHERADRRRSHRVSFMGETWAARKPRGGGCAGGPGCVTRRFGSSPAT